MKKNVKSLCLMVLGLFVSLLAIVTPRVYSATAEDTETKNAPTYLSDLKPLPESTAYIADKDAEGKPLQTLKMKFDKGLCVTTNSELIYTIGGKYSSLQIALGHSSAYPEFKGKLIFTILGDGKILYESKPLSAQDTEEVKVDVSNVGDLSLRVSGQGGDSQFVIWGDAILR